MYIWKTPPAVLQLINAYKQTSANRLSVPDTILPSVAFKRFAVFCQLSTHIAYNFFFLIYIMFCSQMFAFWKYMS